MVNQIEDAVGDMIERMKGKLPVNVRAINGINFKALKVNKVDGKNAKIGKDEAQGKPHVRMATANV